MGIIGWEHHTVLAENLHHIAQRCLFRLAGDINRAVFNVSAGLFPHIRERATPAGFVFVVEAVHHVREPAATGFEESDLQTREVFQTSMADDAGELDHERKGVFQSMDLALIFEVVKAESATRGAVDAEGNSKNLRLAKARSEGGMT